MYSLKFGRVSRQLFTAMVFVFLAPATLFSQNQIPASDFRRHIADEGHPNTPMGPVLVTTGTFGLLTELTEENVKIEQWPTNIIPPEAITTLEEIKDMVTLTRMSRGMPIVKGSIGTKNYNPPAPGIAPHMKVVAVRTLTDDVIGPPLRPGNRVDVIGVFKRRDRSTNLITTNSRTFLKGVQVYSIGNRTTIDNDAKPRTSAASSIVGLLVTAKQSKALVFASDNGGIKLVLRGDDVENTGEVGSLDEVREMISEEEAEDIKVFQEIKNLRAHLDKQQQVLQQFKKRLEQLERLEQAEPSK